MNLLPILIFLALTSQLGARTSQDKGSLYQKFISGVEYAIRAQILWKLQDRFHPTTRTSASLCLLVLDRFEN